jgi:hypothetical protein
MTKTLLAVLTSIILLSCSQKNSSSTETQNAGNYTKNNLNIQASTFIEIDTTGILLFPLSISESEESGVSSSLKKIEETGFWNIIFLNNRTNEYQLLTDKKVLIKDYFVPNETTIQKNTNPNYLFFTIITEDYNKDKKLTKEDPAYLFVTDKFGKNLKQISPGGYHLVNWQYVKTSNKVIMTVQKDSDANNKFDNSDEVSNFEINVDKDPGAKEIFSSELKDKLKSLYNKDWKLAKE